MKLLFLFQEVSTSLEAGILSYFDPASQKYDCLVCPKVGYGDIVPHVSSPQHKNSAAWEAIHQKVPNDLWLSILPDAIKQAKISDDIEAVDKKVFSYQCKICVGKRPFNGLAPLSSHLVGGDHTKNKARFDRSRGSPFNKSREETILKYDSPPRMNQSTSIPKNYQHSDPLESRRGFYNLQQDIHQDVVVEGFVSQAKYRSTTTLSDVREANFFHKTIYIVMRIQPTQLYSSYL